MNTKDDLLIEIGTEELPPKTLKRLQDAFADGLRKELNEAELEFAQLQAFASPRRLGALVSAVNSKQADREVERKGPAVSAAFDKDGNPTPAGLGFAKSCGIELSEASIDDSGKAPRLFVKQTVTGKSIQELAPTMVEKALKQLPIAKLMRWGNYDVEFVRPTHWTVLMFGDVLIPATILGHSSNNQTHGHRYHHPQALTISKPAQYAELLEKEGKVIADFSKRKTVIEQQLHDLAKTINAEVIIDPALLDTVTSMVEWPVALLGNFEKKYLEVPAAAIISAIKGHQYCFHLLDKQGQLLPNFITVSNIASQDPAEVIKGNERVMRARLADAEFFYKTDLDNKMDDWVAQTQTVVYQKKLGTVHDKTQRIIKLSENIAEQLTADTKLAARAATLCKADLMSDMVGEFPELQGIIGERYAEHSKEPGEVSLAIREHYLPRFSGDELPSQAIGIAVSLAERLDTLTGIFGIGMKPTGTKDPFALRRASIGLLRILIEKEIALKLDDLLATATAGYEQELAADTQAQVKAYILERLLHWYKDQGIDDGAVKAALAVQDNNLFDCHRRVQAVLAFTQLDAAKPLAAANKRVRNILEKNKIDLNQQVTIDSKLFEVDAEQALAEASHSLQQDIAPLVKAADYQAILQKLSSLQQVVDTFFDDVMVMCDDEKVRANRIGLLQQLYQLFLQVADIGKL